MTKTNPGAGPAGNWVPNNDEPTLNDQLDREALVREVAQTVASCRPPQVFGIHGDWGAGKTSFLHQLRYRLTGECPGHESDGLTDQQCKDVQKEAKENYGHVKVVWFEAWRYQFEETPIVALLQEIRAQLSWKAKALAEASKLSEVAVRGLLAGLEDLTKKIGIQASKIQEAGEKWEKEHLAFQLPSNSIRQYLEETLDELLKTKKKDGPKPRLVVMIDDLDRCLPEAAFHLLEGIKIYLNLNNCVFVLGMNYSIVRDAVAKHMEKNVRDQEAQQLAHEYIDKLCQNIWHLPLVKKPGSLLRTWLPTETRFEPCCDSLCAQAEECSCLPANPRKLKSFANLLLRFLKKFESEKPGLDSPSHETLVLIMACLYHFHQDIYRIIEQRPGFYQKISDWCKGDDIGHPIFKNLDRILIRSQDAKTPTPELVDAFPDPVHGNVFRAQLLVNALGTVNQTIIDQYLLR